MSCNTVTRTFAIPWSLLLLVVFSPGQARAQCQSAQRQRLSTMQPGSGSFALQRRLAPQTALLPMVLQQQQAALLSALQQTNPALTSAQQTTLSPQTSYLPLLQLQLLAQQQALAETQPGLLSPGRR